MQLQKWEVIIQQIVAESTHDPRESIQKKVLREWRMKLDQEPHSLQIHQIDQIVRAVRDRLKKDSPPANNGPALEIFAFSKVQA